MIQHPSRIQDVRFVLHPSSSSVSTPYELLLVSAEDKKTTIYARTRSPTTQNDSNEGDDEGPTEAYKPIAELVGHANRFVSLFSFLFFFFLGSLHLRSENKNLTCKSYSVKAIDTLQIALPLPSPSNSSTTPTRTETTTTILASASSDGKIHVYDLRSVPLPLQSADISTGIPTQIEPIAEYDTKGTRLTCLTLAGSDSSDAETSKGSIVGGKRGREDDEDDNDEGDEDGEEEEEEEGEGEEEEDEEEMESE